jgi:hypothetical protein
VKREKLKKKKNEGELGLGALARKGVPCKIVSGRFYAKTTMFSNFIFFMLK